MTLSLESLLSVPQLIVERAKLTPHAPAWCWWDNNSLHTFTWEEYYHRILRLAHGFKKLSIGTGDHIAICAANSMEWELCEKAGLFLGATVIGIDAHAPIEAQSYILSHAKVNVIITQTHNSLNALTAHYTTPLKYAILLDDTKIQETNFPITRYTFVFQQGSTEALALPDPNAMAAIIYTSGSTGMPKGIPYTQQQYLVTAQGILDPKLPSLVKSQSENEISICWLPLSNLFQRVINTIMIAWGGCSYLLQDPKLIMETIPKVNPTILIGVPRFYEKIQSAIEHKISTFPAFKKWMVQKSLQLGEKHQALQQTHNTASTCFKIKYHCAKALVLNPIRQKLFGTNIYTLITGSAPTPKHVLNFFHSINAPLLEAYGLSENIIPIAMNRPNAMRFGSVGKPLLYHHVKLGNDNEVLVKGPGVFQGYLNDPNQEARIDTDGYLGTSDYGYIDEDGYLFLTGRKSDLIKTSTGRRIFPRQIEAQLTSIPLVENAVVIGNTQKYLTAILALAPQYYSSIGQAKQECLAHIQAINPLFSSYEAIQGAILIPQGFSLEKGQLTTNMKLRRQVIEKQYEQQIRKLYHHIDTHSPPHPFIVEVTS
jgi:long-chain acyl-CoA synthetase